MESPSHSHTDMPDLAAGLLKLDHTTIAAEVRQRIQTGMDDHRYDKTWKAQYNRVLGDRLKEASGVHMDLTISRVGIEILWNYFWQILQKLHRSHQDFREAKETIIHAVTEMAQHGGMLNQTKFFAIEETHPALRGERRSPFILTRSEGDKTLTVMADPELLAHCRKTKDANLDNSMRHCPAIASMHKIVASLYDVFCDSLNGDEPPKIRSVSEIEHC